MARVLPDRVVRGTPFANLNAEVGKEVAPLPQELDEERRGTGLEPVGAEGLPLPDEEQNVVGVVDPVPQEAVPVVPLA